MSSPGWIRAGLAVALLVTQALAQCQNAPIARFAVRAAPGYTARLLMNGLQRPRGLTIDGDGNLLVVDRGAGVRQVRVTESNGIACVQSSRLLIQDNSLNHGIALAPDNTTLFVSSVDSVFAYTYNASAGTVTGRKEIVTQMRNTDHMTRTLWVSRMDPSILLVQRGSSENIDPDAAQEATGRSMIRYFDIPQIMNSSVQYATGGKLLAMGLRNSAAFAENEAKGEFWAVDNGIDNLSRQGRDVHTDNPGEELNFLGALNASNPNMGGNFGYPSCASAWQPSSLGNTTLQVGSQIAVNTSALSDSDCSSRFIAPRLVFPSHTAPLDIKFAADGRYAFVAFHGSWNRQPPDGFRVMRVDFGADGQPTANLTSQNAGTTIVANTNNGLCPNGCFRPVGLAIDSRRGRLFMTSDSTGEIYVISGGTGLSG